VRLHPQAALEQLPVNEFDDQFPPELDPIFATREFDVPAQAVGGLVDAIPIWKD
jgi:hypothetical protein